MVCRTEQEKYFEGEAETLQDSLADKSSAVRFFKDINFENVGRARRLLVKLKQEMSLMEGLTKELEKRITDYEDWVMVDTYLAMEVR